MQMSYGLTLTQTQKLVMTPELRQAITILQLSSVELGEYIEQEFLNNPFLEISEEVLPKNDEMGEKNQSDSSSNTSESVDWEEYFQDNSDFGFSRYPKEKREDGPNYENFISSTPSLQEHLMVQLHLSNISKTCFKIGEFLIGNIDKNGYLTFGVAEAAKLLKVSEEEVRKALQVIQTFEPVGVGARSLTECLLIQLEQKGIDFPEIKALVKNHLTDLAEARYNIIADSLNISLSQVQHLRDIIVTLDPKPGRNFSSVNDTHYIIPDATIEKVGNDYVVIMNETLSPKLSINSYYRSLLYSEDKESNISKFLSNRLDSALWLIKSIEQRRITLNKVINSIVAAQRDFLDHGLNYLKPLNLKHIAEKIDMHESTVSRAINGKYVQTPRGVYELKFFFQTGLDSVNGSSISTKTIKMMLKEMVDNEDPYNPLSDQKIADIFRKQGIIIARRTVAKYREELGIPSSTKRKRF